MSRLVPKMKREQTDRLTLITSWRHFVPEQPVLVQTGEIIWNENDHLMVRRNAGRLDSYPGAYR
jgi:hypothetical protein